MNLITRWEIPMRTISEANCSEHWTKKNKRHDAQKKWIKIYYKNEPLKLKPPCKIKLTRIGKKQLDKDDNLPISLKWVKDAIADCLISGLAPGRADDDNRLSWEYDQKIGNDYGVIVEFFSF